LHIHWVPAHENIKGNELADQAAKRGTKLPNQIIDKCVSLLFIKKQIKQACLDE
jgi:ribonuclease HI